MLKTKPIYKPKHIQNNAPMFGTQR